MKLKYIKSKIGILATIFGLLSLASCKDDFDVAPDSTGNVTVLNSIKIINAGANGNVVMEGVVDEDAKTVSFARIDTLTDFSNLKFEAEVSTGAKLDKEVYPVTFEEGQSEKIVVVKVTNNPRYREYLVRLRLKVAVFGADFGTGSTYDFTNNPLGNPVYESFAGLLTRGSGFDGQRVLVVRRGDPHLLNVADLKTGVINKVLLNMTGVSGGTFPINLGAQVNGNTYIANLSSNAPTNPVKVYHWTDPSVAPQLIANVDLSGIAGAGIRHGDNFSAALDSQGNGFLFFGDNAGTKILRLQVDNYTTVTNPTVIASPAVSPGSWVSVNRIGNTSDYIYTAHEAPVTLVSDGVTPSFTMSRTSIPIRALDARVVNFNGERYLIATTAARTGSEATNFYVYDITRGSTVKDALTNLNAQPTITPIFQYSLMGPVNLAPSSQTGFFVKKDAAGKDETLMLYSGAADAGFVFFEFGKKQATD